MVSFGCFVCWFGFHPKARGTSVFSQTLIYKEPIDRMKLYAVKPNAPINCCTKVNRLVAKGSLGCGVASLVRLVSA